MSENTRLVEGGKLEETLSALLQREKTIVEDLTKIIPTIETEEIRSSLQKRLDKSKEAVVALEAGFVPIDGGYFERVDTKSKWRMKWVKDELKKMPEEVRAAWERAKEMGVFKHFAISTGGVDPVLVGKAGGKNFFIGGWINFIGGYQAGFTMTGRKRIED